MNQTLSKSKLILFMITICLATFVQQCDTVIYVIVNDFYVTFPEKTNVVNFILSGPPLIQMFGALLVPVLLKKMSTKDLLVGSTVIYAVSTIFGLSVMNVYYIAVMRSISGLMIGFVQVASLSILAQVYVDEKQYASRVGVFQAALSAVGGVVSMASGFLALKGWVHAYDIYWFSAVLVVLMVAFLPRFKPENSAKAEEKKDTGSKEALGAPFWVVVLEYGIFMTLGMMLLVFVSMYVDEHQLGDSSYVGTVNTLASVGSFAFCAVYGFLFKKFNRGTIYCCAAALGLGCLMLYLFPSRISCLLAYILICGSFGCCVTHVYAYPVMLVPEAKASSALGIASAAYGAAAFLSTYAVTTCMALLHTDSFTMVVLVVLIATVALCAVELLLPRKLKRAVAAKEA